MIESQAELSATRTDNALSFFWPLTTSTAILEQSSTLGADAHWVICTNAVITSWGIGRYSVTTTNTGESVFYRLRQL